MSLSDKYKAQFEKLLFLMEQESGDYFQLTIHRFGNDYDNGWEMNKFTNRPDCHVVVYDMEDGLTDLEGTYQNMEEVEKKMRIMAHDDDFRSPWYHMRCDQYRGTIYKASGGSVSLCENKGKWRLEHLKDNVARPGHVMKNTQDDIEDTNRPLWPTENTFIIEDTYQCHIL